MDDSDSLMLLITRYEAYMYILRSGNFRADDNNSNDDRRTNQLLYPLRMRVG